ncbi:hypothetical protein P2R64_20870 [Priestia megaterium]|jgi:hypothetical protein|uniref:hypothetical protein n=1 Tax=Priestia megaterium TaxID=1404 RepID=UPI0021BE07D4|nr:hypothetical protein [Priestia megaterium]MCT9852831.1 hypothetical protein [Priestia megaterium]MDF1962509.1 hypothetical protein [Priestia megaterium]
MRKNDIYDMLQDVDDTLLLIAENYVKAVENKEMKEILKVKIKNTMENLRSCLDYCIHDIDECVLGKHRIKLYFPYKETKNEFKDIINKNFKGLRNKNPKIYSILESIQDFQNEDSPWLTILCRKTNKVKHDSSLEQKRQDNHQVDIGNGLISMVNTRATFEGCVMNGVPLSLSVSPEGNITSRQPIDPRLSIEKIDWVTFTISGTNRDVLEFLTQCKNGIERMVREIYTEIEKI